MIAGDDSAMGHAPQVSHPQDLRVPVGIPGQTVGDTACAKPLETKAGTPPLLHKMIEQHFPVFGIQMGVSQLGLGMKPSFPSCLPNPFDHLALFPSKYHSRIFTPRSAAFRKVVSP